MLKNASEATLVPKNIFFLKILNLVQSFAECKVSLMADGSLDCYTRTFARFLTLFQNKYQFSSVKKSIFIYARCFNFLA
jgi:hypothetical protein